MKRLIALMLALALAVSVAGCAKTDPTANSTGSTETTGSTEATEPKEKEGVYTRDSYSVSDEEAKAQRETVVATAGDASLTNGLLQIYYWTAVYTFLNEQGYYIYYYGLDPASALDEQTISGGEGTWQQYFLNEALTVWHRYQALALMNDQEALTMDPHMQTELDGTEAMLIQSAEANGFESAEAFLTAQMGPGCTMDDYLRYSDLFYRSYNYYQYMYDQIQFTDEDVEAYFSENEEALAEEGVTKDTKNYGVRHILIEPEGGTKDDSGNTTYSDAEWEACRVAAQALLDQWLAGEATEESFAALAKEHSADPGSNTNGGLYEDLDASTNFAEPFKQWYLDESRQVGDYGLVKSDYGYHIMFLSSAETIWMDYVREILYYNASAEFVNAALEAYPMTAEYEKIALGVVDLSSGES